MRAFRGLLWGGLASALAGALLAVVLFGCAGPGERWRCQPADGTLLTCRTVAEP